MTFAVAADAYDRFMGRYSVPLAPSFADFAGVAAGQRVFDVGCGPGALTTELVGRLRADAVAAVDPSELFVAAARERHPGVDVRQARSTRAAFRNSLETALALTMAATLERVGRIYASVYATRSAREDSLRHSHLHLATLLPRLYAFTCKTTKPAFAGVQESG